MNFLACDLGGTKVLLGIFERVLDDSTKLLFKKKYLSSEWGSFELILEDFLKNECKNIAHPYSACFAVAGPLSKNNAKIINLSWNISGNALQNKFNFKSCELINDDSPKLLSKKKYISSDWDSFDLILEDFLKNECKNITHPSSACFAVAGPLSNNLSLIHISEPTRPS